MSTNLKRVYIGHRLGLLFSVIIFLNQVVLRAEIKALILTIFKPPLQYSLHKIAF